MDPTILAYNNSAGAYDDKFSSYSVYKNRINEFAAMLPRNSRILDLGCGSGINAEIMQNHGHSISGLDQSLSMLKIARKRCPEQSFFQGSVNSIADSELSRNAPYDALSLSFIIVHLGDEECRRLLESLNTLIKGNGLLYLSFMPRTQGKTQGYETTSFSDDKIYFHYHDDNQIVSFLEQMGFCLESRIQEDYTEKDGSVTADLFLILRYIEREE